MYSFEAILVRVAAGVRARQCAAGHCPHPPTHHRGREEGGSPGVSSGPPLLRGWGI